MEFLIRFIRGVKKMPQDAWRYHHDYIVFDGYDYYKGSHNQWRIIPEFTSCSKRKCEHLSDILEKIDCTKKIEKIPQELKDKLGLY